MFLTVLFYTHIIARTVVVCEDSDILAGAFVVTMYMAEVEKESFCIHPPTGCTRHTNAQTQRHAHTHTEREKERKTEREGEGKIETNTDARIRH